MKIKNYKILFLSLALIASCAKEREVETVPEGDKDRWEKSMFLSSPLWMAKRTVIDMSSYGEGAFIGQQTPLYVGSFEFSKDKLKFLKAIDPESDRIEQPDSIFQWDITHSEYRLAESNGRVTSREEENDYIDWDSKRYFVLGITEGAKPVELEDNNCWQSRDAEVIDGTEEVSEEHIAFDVETVYELKSKCITYSRVRRYLTDNLTLTVRTRLSFAPLAGSADYKPYKLTGEEDPLLQKYGYFLTAPESYSDDQRIKNEFMMNRWHPKKKRVNPETGKEEIVPHKIYLAEDFPEEYKWVYLHPEHGVEARTNALFERNGLDIRFDFAEAPEGVRFGDVRYSFVKFVDQFQVGAPLGYGPSDTHPLTGEIIRSDSIIWTGYLEYYISRIKSDLEGELKRGEGDSTLISKMEDHLGPKDSWTQSSDVFAMSEVEGSMEFNTEAGELFYHLLPSYTFSSRGNLYASSFKDKSEDEFNAPLKMSESHQMIFDHLDGSQYEQLKEKYLSEELVTFNQAIHEHNHSSQLQTWEKYTLFNDLNGKDTIYDGEQFLNNFEMALASAKVEVVKNDDGEDVELINGKTKQQIIDTMVYRVAIHEFGHNLNLRHNFYGNIDARNHGEVIPAVDKDGNAIMVPTEVDKDGNVLAEEPLMANRTTSSVMDYKGLVDEMNDVFDWEAYDEAALVYAYSDGEKDLAEGKPAFMYCTDNHRSINAMCNAWDTGYTPSQVVKGLIERYDNAYWVRNFRYDRQYWHAGGYTSQVISDLLAPYKFLAFYKETYGVDMRKLLKEKGEYTSKEIDAIVRDINKDFKQAVLMTAAFYDAVIRQSTVERPWEDEYVDWSGALERKGIAADKIYATLFLLGNVRLSYSGDYANPYSFVEFINDPQIGKQINDIMINNITKIPAMEQGFIGFGRSLYTETAANYRNIDSRTEAIQKVEFQCYTEEGLKVHLGIDPNNFIRKAGDTPGQLDVAVIAQEDVKDVMFKGIDMDNLSAREKLLAATDVGIVEVNGRYLIASKVANEYVYKLIRDAHIDANNGDSILQQKREINDVYEFTRAAKGENLALSDCK